MYYEKNQTQVRDLTISYIGGGSRGWAWNFMTDLALEENLAGTIRLYDIDRKAAENNAVIGRRIAADKNAKSLWNYAVSDSLEQALTGTDFVIISILPGTFDEMESDVHVPEQYGIYQSVGDTVGAGGFVRALRTIPMFVEIAEAVKAYSPDAWVINYTNPMTVCVRTLYEVFPQIKAFGCCHEVFGTQKLLSIALADISGIENVPREEIKVNVLGINHFTWVDRASWRGTDLFPVYRKFAEKYAETGYTAKKADGNWMNRFFASAERVKMDLFLKYGWIAAAGDRHLAEFLPGNWYLKNPETVEKWKYSLTPVSYRKEDLKKRLEKSERLVSGEEKVVLERSEEEGVLLMKALLGLGDVVSNVNVPNYGQISDLPLNAVVETNALFSRDHIAPVTAGSLPKDIEHLVISHVVNQEGTLEAALKEDKEYAFRVFMNDPQLTISPADGRKLFETMLQNTKEYLPGWNL